MPYTVITEPGVVTSVETEEEINVVITESPVVVDVDEPSIIHVSTPSVGLQGGQGPEGAAIGNFQTVHTWAIGGEVKIAVGDVDFIPPMFVTLTGIQTAAIAKVIHRIHSGTSAQVKLQKNSVDVTGFTAITVTTTTTTTDPADVPVADGDELALVVTAANGWPFNMTFTLVLEHQA